MSKRQRQPFTPPSEGSRQCMIYSRNNGVPPGVPVESSKLDWYYGPTPWDADPGKMWCKSCVAVGRKREAEVLEFDGVHLCGNGHVEEDDEVIASP